MIEGFFKIAQINFKEIKKAQINFKEIKKMDALKQQEYLIYHQVLKHSAESNNSTFDQKQKQFSSTW